MLPTQVVLANASSQRSHSQNYMSNASYKLDTRASNTPKDATATQAFHVEHGMSSTQVVLAKSKLTARQQPEPHKQPY